jgi:predicted DNA-binding protein (UPF0278 family)
MTIDTEKMKALAEKLREDYKNSIKVLPWPYRSVISPTSIDAADAIDTLLAALEAAAADKRDAELWRKWWGYMHRMNKKPFELARDCDQYAALSQRQEES